MMGRLGTLLVVSVLSVGTLVSILVRMQQKTASSSSASLDSKRKKQKFLECVDPATTTTTSTEPISERTHIPQVLEDAYLKLDEHLDRDAPLPNQLAWRDSRPQGIAATKLGGVKVNFLWNAIQQYQRQEGYPCNTVCEVGINAGHSSVLWLEACPKAHAVLFDMPYKSWSQPAFDYLRTTYGQRVEIIEGNSLETVPQYQRDHPNWKCDIIAIDGSKDPAIRYQDFQNFHQVISHKDSLLLLDDASYEVMLADYIFLEKNNVTKAMEETHDLNALYSALLLTNFIELDGACSFAGALNPRQNSSLAARFFHSSAPSSE